MPGQKTQFQSIIITGAASGLGRALARELYIKGYNLALIDIDKDQLDQLYQELLPGENIVSIHVADVSDEAQVKNARDEIVQQHQYIHMLINNAGISVSVSFQQLSQEDFEQVMDVNFWGTVYCSRHFLPFLSRQPGNHLVNIISDFALIGFPAKAAYAASKAATMALTNTLRTELGDKGIRVSMIIPPPMPTGIVQNGTHLSSEKRVKEIDFLNKNGMDTDKAAKKIIAGILAGRYRIVVGTMMFFIDSAARFFPSLTHRWLSKSKKRIDFI